MAPDICSSLHSVNCKLSKDYRNYKQISSKAEEWKIWGSPNGGDDETSLMGHDTVCVGTQVQMFPWKTLKMKTVRSSETMVPT